jgi:hypothetical protein
MEPLFDFIGSYWWLVFPLLPAAGAIGSALERASKRRHKRRLETLRVKGEIKAAQLAARTRPVPTTVASDPKPLTKPSPAQPQLEKLFAAHDAVTARWLDYELDVAKLIAFPTISDGRQPLTAAFLRAKKTADRLRPPSAKAPVTADELNAYAAAVTDFEVAFEVAEREARRLRDSEFTDAERKRLATAQQLLAVALDEAATPAERQVAYRRVRDEIEGLIAVSDDAIVRLEERVAMQLEGPSKNATGGTAAAEPPAGA